MEKKPTPELVDGAQYVNERFRAIRSTGRQFREIQFADCAFERCVFAGSSFSRCSFTGCTFDTCDLSLAVVAGTRVMDVHFVDTKLVGLDWTRVELVARLALSVQFERCVVNQAMFNGLNLRRLRLVDSIAKETDFSGADLTEAVMTGTDFEGARFADTNLTASDFRGAQGYRISPIANRVARGRFSLPEAIGLLDGLGVIID
jgi:fluoroquinolone resistance protein